MPKEGYTSVTLPDGVVAEIDKHGERIGASTRAEAIRDVLRSDNAEIEGRLEAIERELTDVETDDGKSFLSHVKTLEEKLNSIDSEVEDIRKTMEER